MNNNAALLSKQRIQRATYHEEWLELHIKSAIAFTYLLNVEHVNYGNNAWSIKKQQQQHDFVLIVYLQVSHVHTNMFTHPLTFPRGANISPAVLFGIHPDHYSCLSSTLIVWVWIPGQYFFTEHLVVSYPRKPQSSFLKWWRMPELRHCASFSLHVIYSRA